MLIMMQIISEVTTPGVGRAPLVRGLTSNYYKNLANSDVFWALLPFEFLYFRNSR